MPDSADDVIDRLLSAPPPRRASTTYRVQMHAGFRLDDATAIVPYLHDLGVSDIYMSPYLEAKPGSTHGYDIFDHGAINPEIGDDAAHDRLLAALAGQGMGRVLDVVPNHMGIGGPNRFWLDLLELGPQAPSARFFDIDWHPVKEELTDRVLLPILEDQYGIVLESGKLMPEREGGALWLTYQGWRLPLTPASYAIIFERAADTLMAAAGPDEPDVQEFRSIWSAALRLPPRTSKRTEDIEHAVRERDVIKRRLVRLCADSPRVREAVDRAITSFRGHEGEPGDIGLLHRLLEAQVYRLAYWRVASQEINYRRFFDINDLAGLRVEDPVVFEAAHSLILRWVARGGVTALRIDHPDGLADPTGYFYKLQEAIRLDFARRRFESEGGNSADWDRIARTLRNRLREAVHTKPDSHESRWFPIVVEKILSRGESLPGDWVVDGTVGYEYLNVLNGLFVDTQSSEAIDAAYAEFTEDRRPFTEVLYDAKRLIAGVSMASEVNVLARQLNRVSERELTSRDFTMNDLRIALREVIACFPIYRTYIRPDAPVSAHDRGAIEQAVARARRRNPALDVSLFHFVEKALLSEHPEGSPAEDRALREAFVTRFQQATGPVQAKGLEDTAFYRQVKLASLNEVGADPARFGLAPTSFHALNAERLSRWPGALASSATHDTKRGEDTRIRIDAITELADEWRMHLARWSRWNARKKIKLDDERTVPDPVEEYLLYQTLLGAWPFRDSDDAAPEGFVERIQNYVIKAAREAKVHTSWIDRDPSYAESLARFVAEILTGPDAEVFLKDFLPFQRRVAHVGVVHSLTQVLLKLASPGVPDVYQGCDLWDLNLVDPDNRRPVDYGERTRVLNGIRRDLAGGVSRAELARSLFAAPQDGAIKLYLTWAALNHRRAHADLYAQGAYRPLEAEGEHKGRVIAFGRHREGVAVIAAGARLIAPLMGEDGQTSPLGPSIWGATHLMLPDGPIPLRWRDWLSDRMVEVVEHEGRSALPLGEVFTALPVALLTAE